MEFLEDISDPNRKLSIQHRVHMFITNSHQMKHRSFQIRLNKLMQGTLCKSVDVVCDQVRTSLKEED